MSGRGVPMEALKWGALGLMVWDHVAAVVYPHDLAYRLPGRFVFPVLAGLMALHLARGYPPHRYIRKLWPFALAAQPVYAWVFGLPLVWPLNVLFTLLAGVLMVRGRVWEGVGLSLLTEYPFGGPVVYFLSRGQPFWSALALLACYAVFGWPLWALPMVAGVAGLSWYLVARSVPGFRLPWWAGYLFYPGHLAILGVWSRGG